MTLELSYSDDLLSATWKSPGSGLWVATRNGEYLGLVERIDGVYVATPPSGRDLGSFDELADAQLALEGVGPVENRQDVVLLKLIVAMSGFIAIGLAASVLLRWT